MAVAPVAARAATASAVAMNKCPRVAVDMITPGIVSFPVPRPCAEGSTECNRTAQPGSITHIAYNRVGRSRVREKIRFQELAYMAENLCPVRAAQPDRHMDGEAVEQGAQPRGEAVGVDGPELAP